MNRLLTGANWGLAISVTALCATVFVAYWWAANLSLAGQILMHLSIPLWAAGLKIFYVMRIAALRKIELGIE